MKRIQIILLLVFSTNAIVYGQVQLDTSEIIDEQPSEWVSIIENEYEIEYPSNWNADRSGQMGTSFMLFSRLSNELDQFKENITLLIQDLTGHDLNLDQYVDISENQILTLITEGKIMLNERKTKDGKEYQRMIYTGKQGAFNLKFEQYYWVVENKAFILTLTCLEDEFEDYRITGENILNSFRLK